MRTRFSVGDRLALFGGTGEVVAGALTQDGTATMTVDGESAAASVLQAAGPDEALEGAQVWLVREVDGDGYADGWTLMVDDPYWGVRVQPAEFGPLPLEERFEMGYRLRGRVLVAGAPAAGANVSLELVQRCGADGDLTMWDSEEYNELVYSTGLETWVEGPEVRAPIRTTTDGRWAWTAPCGHGAAYQRASDWVHSAAEADGLLPQRWLHEAWACYEGRRVLLTEGTEGVIDVDSASVVVRGTAGAWLKVGVMDDTGEAFCVPAGGEVTITGLPATDVSIVQYRLAGGGEWDSTAGCPRTTVGVLEGAQTVVQMPPIEDYLLEDNILAGRVYERPGVPAANLDVVALDLESGEIAGVLARTDGTGFWSVYIPPEGLGGQPIIHDPKWGTVPVLGGPYSDIVLGARAYSGWTSQTRAELWRKGAFGHKNYPVTTAGVVVVDPAAEMEYETSSTGYGGWVTVHSLPKFRYLAELEELLASGPQLRSYDVRCGDDVLEAGFTLASQPFEEWETPVGACRAAGHYPSVKLLLGGKMHGNVLRDAADRVAEGLPEAARMGLEFGQWRPVAEVRTGATGGALRQLALSGHLCPYCGAPAERVPAGGRASQGYCVQCAETFGSPMAMDCRTYFRSPTTEPGTKRSRVGLRRQLSSAWQDVVSHWRPDHYDEVDAYITQSGAGQPTTAPRWQARHSDELAAPGIAGFDGDAQPPYLVGHDLGYYSGLPTVGRDLGAAQFKVAFAAGYVLPLSLVVDVDCVLLDGSVETRRVALPAGLSGPSASNPFGDVVRVHCAPKLRAEGLPWPYRGCGLYVGVRDVRLVSPQDAPGARFRIVCDVPFLASPLGALVERGHSTPVALQVTSVWGNPHLACDGLGQVFVLHTDEGLIHVHRRGGLLDAWDGGNSLSNDGPSDHAWAGKDPTGGLLIVCESVGAGTSAATSRDDGRQLEG